MTNNKVLKYKELPTATTQYLMLGGGIMSATLASLIKHIKPNADITILERLHTCARESSAAFNNAGTGHAGYCELNYCVMNPETGIVDKSKALKVNKAFRKSKEYWNYLVSTGAIDKKSFTSIPHYSFVTGDDVRFLMNRHIALHLMEGFEGMQFSTDFNIISRWLPLIIKGRDKTIPVAASRYDGGLDIDFGNLTKDLIHHLTRKGASVRYLHEVIDLYQVDGVWNVIVKDLSNDSLIRFQTDFVFIGAGGAAINLLEKSGIPEAKNYGGFPVSGEWLVTANNEVVRQHNGKVYGNPSADAPPMSVPHLDTRVINGTSYLLFGPFAAMSTKFLKQGSYLDFFKSITLDNILMMIDAGLRNMGLNKYLAKELLKGSSARFKELKKYYPEADEKDWQPLVAGQRVQVIKKVDGRGSIEFGTEVITNAENNLACLLGASPGASTSVKIMLDVINKCVPMNTEEEEKLKEAIPSYDN